MSTRVAVACSERSDTSAAFTEAAVEVASELGDRCDLCVVFASGRHLTRPDEVLAAVHDELAPTSLIGCGAAGLVAGSREIESGTAALVWGASFDYPGVATHALPGRDAEPDLDGLEDADWETLLLLADPYSFTSDSALDALHEANPGRPVLGGLASAAVGGEAVLFRDREVLHGGAVAASLRGVSVLPTVSQGATAVGPTLRVTAADGNSVIELDGEPALQQLETVITELPDADRRKAAAGLMLGIDVGSGPASQGAYLVRPVVGVDKQHGSVLVGQTVEAGQVVRLYVRDEQSADEDLRSALDVQAEAVGSGGAAGALLFTCNGRGTNMFSEPHHDAEALTQRLGVVPAGFFCAGEIGPVGGRSFLHGFTATMAVFPAD
ncbi:MAG: FIST signal transduction protein [Solirubrobacterales bacterium]